MIKKFVSVFFILSTLACSKKQITTTKAFSPNGDGINDYWTFTGFGNDLDANIHVFNKEGLLVFECTGKNPVWSGKYGEADASRGLYYYTIKTKNSKDLITGSVMLIR